MLRGRCERGYSLTGRRRWRRCSLGGSSRWNRGLDRRDIGFAPRGKRSIDLRLDQHIVRTAYHNEMLDIVASDQDELPLAVEAERVDEA